jgi:TIR domain
MLGFAPQSSGTGSQMNKKYDIAISFAGKDRSTAEDIAKILVSKGIQVFYDNFENADLWGKDLYEYLTHIYKDNSKYCLMLLSESYKEKVWTTHERKAAQARAFKESQEYILPIRLDDTDIPGILETTGYIDIRSKSIQEICDLIETKLWGDFKNDKGISILKNNLKEVYNGTMLICDYVLAPLSEESNYKLSVAPNVYRSVLEKYIKCKQYCLLNNNNFDRLILESLTKFLDQTEYLLKLSVFLLERTNINNKNHDFIFELPDSQINETFDFIKKIGIDTYSSPNSKFYTPNEILESWKLAEKSQSNIFLDPSNYVSKPGISMYVFNTKVMEKIHGSVGDTIKIFTH